MEGSDAAETDLESRRLEAEACELERVISSLLQTHDPRANESITNFVTLPRAWSVSLYLAFPPPGSGVGAAAAEVRFFALNLLLSKIRGDSSQVPAEEAQEIYEALMRQLPLNLENRMVGARLCLVVSSAAALAGADTCYNLVESIVGGFIQEGPLLAVELLINLAEETLHRSMALPWQVGVCMQECSPQVLAYLQFLVTSSPGGSGREELLVARVLVCLERWMLAGITLSELYMENAPLLKVVLDSLGSPDEACFEGAVATLLELIAAVDPLPGREDAIRATVAAILTQKGQFVAAMAMSAGDETLKRALGLLSLVAAICSAEAYLLARGGQDAAGMLEWLVLGLGGGGSLGLEGASIAAESWTRLLAVPKSKRSEILQAQFCAAGTQAVLQATAYPRDFTTWQQQSEVDEDDFYRFREGFAKDALVACFVELGSDLLSHIVQRLRAAANWQEAEVCLYAATSISKVVIATVSGNIQNGTERGHLVVIEEDVAKSFLLAIISMLPGSAAVIQRDSASLPHPRLVATASRLIESYADCIAALDRSTLEISLGYVVGALYVPAATSTASSAFKELCRVAASSIAAAGVLPTLMAACEEALSSVPPRTYQRVLGVLDLLAVIKGLAQVAAALPSLEEAKSTLVSLTTYAVATVKGFAGRVDGMDDYGPYLAEELRVIATAIDGGVMMTNETEKACAHPGLVILQEVWPALKIIADHWAHDVEVSSAVCELWAITTQKTGVALTGVLPEVISLATSLFKQHHASVCVDCITDILKVTSQDTCSSSQQVQEILGKSLLELTEVGTLLTQIADNSLLGYKQGTTALHAFAEQNSEDSLAAKKKKIAATGLQALCRLGRTFLQHQPTLLVLSPAFSVLVYCAIGCVRRKEVGHTLSAVKFLAESVMGLGYLDSEGIDRIAWRLPSELVPHADTVVSVHLHGMVDVALKALAGNQLVPVSQDAVSDIFYGLCLRHAELCKAAMIATLNASDFPTKPGVLTESVKTRLILAAIRQPVHPRRRFQELLGSFSRVCQGQMPADVLDLYQ